MMRLAQGRSCRSFGQSSNVGGSSDTTPDAFTFSDQSGVSLSTTITSLAITVAGINAPAVISVSGGTYDINASGSFTSSAGVVNNGDTVRARHTSSGSNSTAVDTVVTIGGVSDTFTSTTVSGGALFPSFPFDPTRSIWAGTYYLVDPVNGSDSNNGIPVSKGGTGPKRTINAAIPLGGPDIYIYLMDGTHVVTALNNKFLGSDGTSGHPCVITSYPGDEPIIDCNGLTIWLKHQRGYWQFRHLFFENYISAIQIAEDLNTPNNTFFCIEGETSLGGDNVGLIQVVDVDRTPNLLVDRYRVTCLVNPTTLHQNTAGIYVKRTTSDSVTLDHMEIYGFPMGIYHKHGEPSPSVSGNAICRNSIFVGQSRGAVGFNPSGWFYKDCIFGDGAIVRLAEDDGGQAGDLNEFEHCTFYEGLTLTNQGSNGAQNNKIHNSIVQALTLQSPSTVTSNSDYNLFPSGAITRYGSANTLAQWRTNNGSDANSVQGSPSYTGSDYQTLGAYLLQGGSPGKNAASDGTDMGARVANIGVQAT